MSKAVQALKNARKTNTGSPLFIQAVKLLCAGICMIDEVVSECVDVFAKYSDDRFRPPHNGYTIWCKYCTVCRCGHTINLSRICTASWHCRSLHRKNKDIEIVPEWVPDNFPQGKLSSSGGLDKSATVDSKDSSASLQACRVFLPALNSSPSFFSFQTLSLSNQNRCFLPSLGLQMMIHGMPAWISWR